MLCPILSIGAGVYGECQKGRCAWYCIQDPETGAGVCAVWNIAMCLQSWREDAEAEAIRRDIKNDKRGW